MTIDEKDKAERKVRRQHVAIGAPLVAVGASLQTAAIGVHDFAPQMFVRGFSILMMIAGIVIMIRGIAKGREARVGKGK